MLIIQAHFHTFYALKVLASEVYVFDATYKLRSNFKWREHIYEQAVLLRHKKNRIEECGFLMWYRGYLVFPKVMLLDEQIIFDSFSFKQYILTQFVICKHAVSKYI